ncbi:hypothetical protein M440DRAFT_285072 [Trichoderma longibrachiatum ATCC 18648]|uniref:Uncharacterized protein n=1 Tax=Trichoderma longibrachiatum ATCC 18648 TaxID=983965 RepID=A0A2T4C7M0_TRILO|nr:hypothetical protein M440DRAFT_285072 [Trichoderma longibrachiatum ATCC 18648]
MRWHDCHQHDLHLLRPQAVLPLPHVLDDCTRLIETIEPLNIEQSPHKKRHHTISHDPSIQRPVTAKAGSYHDPQQHDLSNTTSATRPKRLFSFSCFPERTSCAIPCFSTTETKHFLQSSQQFFALLGFYGLRSDCLQAILYYYQGSKRTLPLLFVHPSCWIVSI